jgi:hypothetical protein
MLRVALSIGDSFVVDDLMIMIINNSSMGFGDLVTNGYLSMERLRNRAVGVRADILPGSVAQARVAELVDARDLGSRAARRASSSLAFRTITFG